MRVTLRRRLRYRFDNTLARGTPALMAWLVAVAVAVIVVFSAILLGASLTPAVNGKRPDLWHQVYDTAVHALNFASFDTGSWWYVVVEFLLALVALFIVSAFVSLLVTGLTNSADQLRKGRSIVVENGHTVILGWSEAVYTIVRELAIANRHEPDSAIVILADKDKVEMETRLRAKVRHTGNTRVICRSGSPIDSHDLMIANPNSARSIIVLSGGSEDPDVETIKTVLALVHAPDRRPEPFHIVVEIEHEKNLEVARIAGGDEVVALSKGQVIARLMAHASEQSGIALAYIEIFDFDDDEVYFREDPSLAGRSYGDAVLAYDNCCVIGVHTGAGSRINPPPETEIRAGDVIIAIASDAGAIAAARAFDGQVDEAVFADPRGAEAAPSRILMLGWNSRALTVLDELNDFSRPGSAVRIVADTMDVKEAVAEDGRYANLAVDYLAGDIADRHLLDALDVTSFDSLLILSEADVLDAQRADARTLVTLLHLRDIASKAGRRVPIVSEMLDDHNRALAQVTEVDDVIVSEKVISLMLAAISKNPEVKHIFDDLLSANGSEIHIKPVARYVTGPASFATIVASARRFNETAIGYRTLAGRDDPHREFGITMNPMKGARFEAAPGDRVIVLAAE